MRDSTFRTIGATAVLLGIAIVAVAQIGPDEEVPTELVVPEDTRPEPLDVAGDQPFQYRVGLLAGVSTTNFWEYIGDQPTAWNAYVLGPTKPALYGIDSASNELVPELAAEQTPPPPTKDQDGWIVRVELEDEFAWSDGETVTSADVVYTFETVRALGLGGGWTDAYPAEIEAIVAESATELTIELSERPSLGIWPHRIGLAPIMPAHIWAPLTADIDNDRELYGLDGAEDVSGGPLRIVSVTEGRIETAANPGYPGASVDGIVYTVFSDEAAAVSALETGEIDTILNPNGLSEESVSALGDTAEVSIERSPANSVRYLGFNLTRAPMSEPAFRQSLALLLDREAVTESLLPEAEAAYTMLSSANLSWFDEEQASSIAEPYSRDLNGRLEAAMSSLQEAGYAWSTPPAVVDGALSPGIGLTIDGQTPAPLTILTPGDEYDPARPDYTSRIETTLELIGFDVRPVVTDFDTVVDLAFAEDAAGARQYDMYLLGWTLGNPVLPDYYRWLFATDGAANSTGYSDPEFGAQLARYEEATGLVEAKAALWGMEQTLARDLPYLVLYHPDIVEGYRSDRVRFDQHAVLGGIQGRLGGLADLHPVS